MASAHTTVTFVGTDAVVPAGGHDTASFVINGRYLVDTGWYGAIKMQGYGIDPAALECLFLTHCHHDHTLGLPHLLLYRSFKLGKAAASRPLKIFGPAADLAEVVDLAQKFLRPEQFPEIVCATDLVALKPGYSYETDAFLLEPCAAKHPVAALCYRFTDKTTGATIAFTGDTGYDPKIAAHVRGVGLLIHEASYGAEHAPKDDKWGHSGAPDAAHVALQAGVRRLALIHCPEHKRAGALDAAQAIFPSTFLATEGETIIVEP